MSVAASGMAAEQANLDVVAANLSSADVTAFKANIAHVIALRQGDQSLGVAVDGTRMRCEQGKCMRSGGPCDLAINGDGFFVVERGGHVAYTRAGAFSRAHDGTLTDANGWHLSGIRIPASATKLHVETDGRVMVETPEHHNVCVGGLRLALTAAPERMQPVDDTTFMSTRESGAAVLIKPGKDGGPSIEFGMLEKSNVSIVESMMEILAAQRAYEADAKGVQAADDMVRIANNLQRS